MRRRAKIDANHTEVVDALRSVGWRVFSLAALGRGCPDLLTWHPTRGWRLVEVKARKGKLTADQVAFMVQGWPVTIVRTVEEALSL